MYRVVIVDDEAIIRDGLRKKINWEALGFACVGSCENGREAIAKLDEMAPDVIITDIYMPFVDGLELSEYVAKNKPACKVIILTGYDEFDYAQKALKLQVQDYILKPITAKEVEKILCKVKEDLDSEKSKDYEIERMEKLLLESRPLIRERFLNRLLIGDMTAGEIEEKLEYFDMDVLLSAKGKQAFAVVVLDTEREHQNDYRQEDLRHFALFNISKELLEQEEAGSVFQNIEEKTIAIFAGEPDELQEKAKGICQQIMDIMADKLNFSATAAMGRLVFNLENIHESYKTAINLLEYRFFLGNNRILSIRELPDAAQKRAMNIEKDEVEILRALKGAQAEKQEELVAGFFERLRESGLSMEEVYLLIQRLLIRMEQAMLDIDIDVNSLLGFEKNIVIEVYRYNTLEDIKNWFLKICRGISAELLQQRESFSENLVLQAQQYIKEHYENPDINVGLVSQNLAISVSYFSNLFKSHTGETFTEYLTQIRMEKAKDLLLSTKMKSYEIAYKVGYSDPHYFSIAFKKKLGLTPTQFREAQSS